MQPHPESTGNKQALTTRFKPGQSGNPNGRPKGSRNKLSELFVSDLMALWEQHGRDVLVACIKDKPGDVLRAVSALVPKDFHVEHNAGPSFRALWEAVAKGAVPPPAPDEEE